LYVSKDFVPAAAALAVDGEELVLVLLVVLLLSLPLSLLLLELEEETEASSFKSSLAASFRCSGRDCNGGLMLHTELVVSARL
jgi:hypothetical protein